MISNVVGRLLCSKTVVTVWCGWILSLLFQTICLLWTTCSHCCPQRNEFSPSGVSGQQRERGSKRKAMIELIFYIYINLYFSDSGGVTIHFDLSLQGQESIKFKNSFHHLWLLILFGIFFEKKGRPIWQQQLEKHFKSSTKNTSFQIQQYRKYCLSSNIYTVLGTPDTGCVSVQGLHSLEEHLKANYVTMPRKGCPKLKAPPNAAHKCSFFSLLFEDARLLPFRGLTYPKILCAREKGRQEKRKWRHRVV